MGGKTVNPNWVSGHYKAIDRSVDTSVGSWVFQAEDTPWTPGTSVYNIGLVIGWGENAGQTTSTSSGAITLQFAVNGGSFTTVTASTAVKYANSSAVTDGGTYGTAYTSAPTGVASWGGTGEYDENNSVSAKTPVDQYFEALFVLEIDPAQLNDNDVLTFQILHGGAGWDAVDTTPQITVNKPNQYTLTADAGSYTITGQTAQVLKSRLLTANNGSYTSTGQAATITWTPVTGYTLTADAGSYTITGQAATITYLQNFTVTADAGAYSITGQAATLLKTNILSASNGSYTLTGQAATFDYGVPPRKARLLMEDGFALLQEDGSYILTEPIEYMILSQFGVYTLTGQAASILQGYKLTADAGSYTLTGQSADLLHGSLLTADAGSYSLTGQDATILKDSVLTADAGSYTVTGQAAEIDRSYLLIADAGSYTVTGQDATILKTSLLSADAGSYTVNGQNATIVWTPAGAYDLIANTGSYTLTGQSAVISKTRILTAEAGTYTVTGQDAVIDYTGSYTITAEPGSYVLTGQSASIIYVGTAQAGGGIGKKSRKTRGWANEREQLQASLEVSKDFAPSPELVQAREVLAKAPNKIARKLARKVADYSGELGEYRTLEREYIKLQTQIEFNRQKTEAERKALEVVRAFIKDEQEAVEVLMLIDDIDAEILSVGMM